MAGLQDVNIEQRLNPIMLCSQSSQPRLRVIPDFRFVFLVVHGNGIPIVNSIDSIGLRSVVGLIFESAIWLVYK